MTSSEPTADRRSFGRKATYQHAAAVIAGRPPVRCVVSDLSEGGAFLDFGGAVTLPARFQLRWEGRSQIANCEVRHAESTGVGVQFTCAVGPQIAREAKAAMRSVADAPAAEELAPADPVTIDDAPQAAAEPSLALTPPPLPAWFVAPDTAAGLVQSLRMQRANRPPPPPEPPKSSAAPKMFGWLQR
ncbi:MAG: PilZ domain-containing protein [Hyphomicrobium sp.]